jgi:hypothetical protein
VGLSADPFFSKAKLVHPRLKCQIVAAAYLLSSYPVYPSDGLFMTHTHHALKESVFAYPSDYRASAHEVSPPPQNRNVCVPDWR